MSCMVTATNWPSPSSSTCGQDEEDDEEGGEELDKDDDKDVKYTHTDTLKTKLSPPIQICLNIQRLR